MKYLLAAKLDFLINGSRQQYSISRGLHLNSKDWKSYVHLKTKLFYNFLKNGTIEFTTQSDISGEKYIQHLKISEFKKLEPILFLLLVLKIPENDIINFIKVFMLNSEARLACSCPSFLYWGAKYNLTQLKSCYGPGETRPPDERDPHRKFLVCKHLWVVLDNFENDIEKFIKDLLPYYIRFFGLQSPLALDRMIKRMNKKYVVNLIEKAKKNVNSLNSNELKSLFDNLTRNKMNDLYKVFNVQNKEEQLKEQQQEQQSKEETKVEEVEVKEEE